MMTATESTEQNMPSKAKARYKAALYIRLSKEDADRAESYSVINQRSLLTDYVNKQPDIEIGDYYIDDGWSGVLYDDRPDFQRMLSDIYSGEVTCVVVKDSSRFGRDAAEQGYYISKVFPMLGVRYISVNESFDSNESHSSSVSLLNNGMHWLFNELYVSDNSVRVLSSLNILKKQGKFIGSFPKYGYLKDPLDHHKLVIDEPAADNVRMIYRLYLNSTGIRGIVRYLNDHGIPNPSAYKRIIGMNYRSGTDGGSALWCDKTVRRILADEMYTGVMIQGKHRKLSYKSKKLIECDESEWFRVEGTHEAIISREDFERVRQMLGKNVKGSAAGGKVNLFAGLLRCADCGRALIKKINNNPDKTYTYYRCSTHKKCKSACTAHTIRFETLYAAVLYCVRQMISFAVDPETVLKETGRRRSSPAITNIDNQLGIQMQELERLRALLDDLYPDYKRGILSESSYLRNKDRFERELNRIEESISKLKATAEESAENNERSDDFIEHFKQHGNIDRLTRPLLTELIDHITVSEDGSLDIAFNFTDAFLDAQMMTENKLSA